MSAAYGWCLTRVGRYSSSTSLGWSLLPSSVIIVLALVNSAVSHRGLRYLNETWECCPTPCQYHFHRTAVPFMVETTPKWNAWLPLHIFCIWCMTILGIPGWVPTDDMQPKPWVKAHLSCNPSHQVWIVRTSGKGNTLSYQRVFPLDPYVHVQAGMARATIHLGDNYFEPLRSTLR